jgi:hypothetical protein
MAGLRESLALKETLEAATPGEKNLCPSCKGTGKAVVYVGSHGVATGMCLCRGGLFWSVGVAPRDEWMWGSRD